MKKCLIAAVLMFAASFMFAASDAFKNAAKDVREAQKAKDWAKVVSVFETAMPNLSEPKEQVEALSAMANAYLKLNKPDEAIAKLTQITTIKGASEREVNTAFFKIASVYVEQKKPDEALKIYAKIAAETKNPLVKCYAQLSAAELKEKMKKPDEAASELDKIMVTDEMSDREKQEIAARMANVNVRLKKYDKAEALYKDAIAAAGKEAESHAAKEAEKAAKAAAKGKEYKPAHTGCGKVIDLRMRLAKVYLTQNKTKEAMAEVETCLQLAGITEKQRAEVISKKISMLTEAKMYAEANTAIQENLAQTKNPDEMVSLYNKIASNYAKMGDKENALKTLDQAAAVIGATKAKPDEKLRQKLLKPDPAPKAPKSKKADAKDAPAPAPAPAAK